MLTIDKKPPISCHTLTKSLSLVILALISACSKVENSFVVIDEAGIVVTASLDLCGSAIPLQRDGDRLIAIKAIACEGSGKIVLRYTSGAEQECTVGYVTPGAAQSFEFRATEEGCA